MAWKVMQELADMMKPEQAPGIDDRLLQKQMREKSVRDYFNEQIYAYLRLNHKGMWELTMEDYAKMTEKYNTRQKQVFQEQLIKAMKTNRWKPISWIKEHNKSILLNQLLD